MPFLSADKEIYNWHIWLMHRHLLFFFPNVLDSLSPLRQVNEFSFALTHTCTLLTTLIHDYTNTSIFIHSHSCFLIMHYVEYRYLKKKLNKDNAFIARKNVSIVLFMWFITIGLIHKWAQYCGWSDQLTFTLWLQNVNQLQQYSAASQYGVSSLWKCGCS